MAGSVFAVINPTAGSGRARGIWTQTAARLRALGIDFEFEMTQGPMTAESFTRQAVRKGATTVIVVGGDGTVNEAINGLFVDGEPISADCRFLIVPAGSSSDAANGLGIPLGAEAVDLLGHGRLAALDVGRAAFSEKDRQTFRYFINNADVGIGGRIARGAGGFKWAGGRIAFFLSSLSALASSTSWSGQLRIDDGELTPIEAVSLFVGLGPLTGGGMVVAPDAKWDDGFFDVITIDPMSPGELLMHFPRVYRGTHLSHPKVHHQRARTIHIETPNLPFIELDGEVVGSGGVEFRILPAFLQVYVPLP